MGKTRVNEVRKGGKGSRKGNRGADNHHQSQLKNTVGKISADISAISLGPPRTKILKKTSSSSGSNATSFLSSNFASRLKVLQKKKVTFCQNLIAEELKEQKRTGTGKDVKNYFKVIHPSAIRKRHANRDSGAAAGFDGESKSTTAIIPDPEVLKTTPTPELRKIIKKSTKNKKIRLRARKETFKRKMELLKANREEVKKTTQRKQTVIVGDMHPMLQALPSLPTDFDDIKTNETDLMTNSDEQEKCIPKKTKFSVKKTKQAILDSLKFFEVAAGLSKN